MCFLCVVFVVSNVDIVFIGELCMEECLIGDLVDVLCEVDVEVIYFKNEGFLLF